MKFSRDAAIPRIPAPHLLKQGQLQLAGASFRDIYIYIYVCIHIMDINNLMTGGDVNQYDLQDPW